MKKISSLILVLGIAIAVSASISIPYNNAKSPSLSLPLAYNQALQALGPLTNDFHCVAANVETSFSRDGEWFFTFYSTNAKPKWISVEFTGKIHVEDILLR